MDGLILLGILLVVLVAVIMPLAIIILFYRLKGTREQLNALSQRVASLTAGRDAASGNTATAATRAGDGFRPVRPAASAEPEASASPAAAVAPEASSSHAAPGFDGWTGGQNASSLANEGAPMPGAGLVRGAMARFLLRNAGARGPGAPAAPGPSLFSGIANWFMRGNPLAKLGIMLLFFGLAYLLRYSIEQNYLSVEMRLAGAALISLLLLAVGWRLRLRRQLYALILQGGAVGAFYITVFGACKLYHQLPFTLAFVLMIAVCAASVGLAVLQSSLSLAMLASLGGYLAPLLLANGDGSHIGLFTYYLCISCGILAVSRWQSWRALNLLGFIFTFGIGGLWGYNHYQPAYYLSCQLFLIANLLLFGLLSLMFGVKNVLKGQWAVDGTLLFGPPLVGFGYQYLISREWHYGPAFSALGFGLFYLLAARLAFKRNPGQGRMLSLAGLALAAAFATLAIPLALAAQWTAVAWTLEGLGIVWLGVSQAQRRFYWSGSAVMLLAALAAVRAWSHGMALISFTTVFALLALAALAAGALWQRRPPADKLYTRFSLGFLGASLLFWIWTLAGLAHRLMPTFSRAAMLFLLLMTLSVWIWRALAVRLRFAALRHAVWLLWPAGVMALAVQLYALGHPLSAGGWSLAWPCAVVTGIGLLRRYEAGITPRRLPVLLHLSGFWLLLAFIAGELIWRAARLPWGNTEWQFAILAVGLVLPMALVLWLDAAGRWPLTLHYRLYWHYALTPVLPLLLILLATGNLLDGQMPGWRFLPLLNPLEESAMAALLMLGWWIRRAWPGAIFMPYLRLLALLLSAWWLNGVLLRLLAWYGDVPWLAYDLWHSRLIQTAFALIWTFAAMLGMLYASRRGSRFIWFCGVALLIVTVLKLFLVDGAASGGLSRAVAFLGVAILLLVIGYFVPLPPRRITGKEPQ